MLHKGREWQVIGEAHGGKDYQPLMEGGNDTGGWSGLSSKLLCAALVALAMVRTKSGIALVLGSMRLRLPCEMVM